MTDARVESFWFGRERARCFGMLHLPAGEAQRGVVLCNSVGFEGQTSQRALRRLADRLVEQGLAVLRFDYDGTGDSDGGDWEDNRVDAWIESVDLAIDALHARSGISDVQLVGIRLGADLAYPVAGRRKVSGIALWWPVASGSAFARELRAMARLSAAARPDDQMVTDWFPADSLEAVGYEFSASTIAGMKAIARDAAEMPAPEVLVVDRTDAPANDALVEQLRGAHCTVEQVSGPGYAEHMTEDETRSATPRESIELIASWLERTTPRAETTFSPVQNEDALHVEEPAVGSLLPRDGRGRPVIERPVVVAGSLFAISSIAEGASAETARAAILLCTTGATSRVGPGRLYVRLARYWANLGFFVIRLDLGGAGDSLEVSDDNYAQQAYSPIRRRELALALEWLRAQTGHDRDSMFGVCSGAFNAFHAALQGAEPSSIVLVNPALFYLGPNDELSGSSDHAFHSAHTMSRALASGERWKRVLTDRKAFGDALRRARELLGSHALRGYVHLLLARAVLVLERLGFRRNKSTPVARDLAKIAAKTDVQLIFAADEPGEHYLRVFGADAFESLVDSNVVGLTLIRGGDHVFSPPGARAELIRVSTAYLERSFPLDGDAAQVAPAYASEAGGDAVMYRPNTGRTG
jgi:predicted alpha/beta hydrolase